MEKDVYSNTSEFECNGKKILVIRMSGAACVMSEDDYNRIIITKRKNKQWKRKAS